tara:strand:- start:311 stop:502 length:192 start_codon:yes stop_codon:yes gene_type:complete
MSVVTVKPPMTDKLWGIHRILAERIFNLYLLWENATKSQKSEAEKRLIKVLAARSKYNKAPRA